MDGFLLVLWVDPVPLPRPPLPVPFAVVRALLRDLRAAAREPEPPGRPAGRRRLARAASRRAGRSFALDAITTLGRDVNNAIVVDDPFASAEHAILTYPRPRLVRRGPREHERHVRQRPAASTGVASLGFGDESRSARSGSGSSGRDR